MYRRREIRRPACVQKRRNERKKSAARHALVGTKKNIINERTTDNEHRERDRHTPNRAIVAYVIILYIQSERLSDFFRPTVHETIARRVRNVYVTETDIYLFGRDDFRFSIIRRLGLVWFRSFSARVPPLSKTTPRRPCSSAPEPPNPFDTGNSYFSDTAICGEYATEFFG